MKYYINAKGILGLKTNVDRVNWVYGSEAPQSSEEEFRNCKIKVNLLVKKTKDTFDHDFSKAKLDRFNYFYAAKDRKKIYYERDFLFRTKLRYSVEIIDEHTVNLSVNENYFRYIKYKFMNIHSIGYIMTDIVSGLLLLNGYATLHCSAVSIESKGTLIFAPPGTGKTITALRLCEDRNVKFMSEDIAITDGVNLYSVPWTSTFRYYHHHKQSRREMMISKIRKLVPVFQLISVRKKSASAFFEELSFVERSTISRLILLSSGEVDAIQKIDDVKRQILNLNRYEFNYDKAPTMLVFHYFNPDFDLEKMSRSEQSIVLKMTSDSEAFLVSSANALEYASLIRKIVNTDSEEVQVLK